MTSDSPLFNLLPELLDAVIAFLPRKRDVYHLRQTHRHFQHSAQQAVLKDVALALHCDSLDDNHFHLSYFHDALCDDESMKKLVHSLRLEYRCGPVRLSQGRATAISREERASNKTWISNMRAQIDIARKLIAKLPRLACITIRLFGYDFETTNEIIFSILQRFINDAQVPVTMESQYPYHAMREKLLTFCGRDKIIFDEMPKKSLAKGPRLYIGRIFDSTFTNHDVRELDLGKLLVSERFPSSVLMSNLAASFSRLVVLRGRVERLYEVPDFILSLAPLRNTLQTLELRHTPVCHRFAHSVPHRPVDLGLLTQLRTLHVPSSAWVQQPACDVHSASSLDQPAAGFIWRFPEQGRMDIHTYLPPSLENLTISFVWPDAIFARGWNYSQQFKLLPPATQMQGFDWILTLLETNVRKMKLIEEAGGDHMFCSHWGRPDCVWDLQISKMKLPKAARQALDAAGVELEIFLLEELEQVPALIEASH